MGKFTLPDGSVFEGDPKVLIEQMYPSGIPVWLDVLTSPYYVSTELDRQLAIALGGYEEFAPGDLVSLSTELQNNHGQGPFVVVRTQSVPIMTISYWRYCQGVHSGIGEYPGPFGAVGHPQWLNLCTRVTMGAIINATHANLVARVNNMPDQYQEIWPEIARACFANFSRNQMVVWSDEAKPDRRQTFGSGPFQITGIGLRNFVRHDQWLATELKKAAIGEPYSPWKPFGDGSGHPQDIYLVGMGDAENNLSFDGIEFHPYRPVS